MATKLETKMMDGNTAAAYASYPYTEVATIYPITPSSQMAELVDEWSANGRKNIFGETVQVREMQSELGAAAALHGALQAGALGSTYTSSQGLMLMVPNMFKIAGELLPGVIHVSARAIASNALSIYGDHQDVMSCRTTGFVILASSSVQQAYFLGTVAHLATVPARLPILHFFDGFRTSHEYQKIKVFDLDTCIEMADYDAIEAQRSRSLNPNRPVSRGLAENPDIFFQTRESINHFYDEFPKILKEKMDLVNSKAGTDFKFYNYYGASDAEEMIVSMGSSCEVIKETIDYWNANGKKLGLLEVHLYRPFLPNDFLAEIPASVKRIAVLDRTKEPGAMGEPLYNDVVNAFSKYSDRDPLIVGGRYGLGSKDFTPNNVMSVYENLHANKPINSFTVGITDDVTNLSLPVYKETFDSTPKGNVSYKFWGLGSDGTVGANKSTVKIIGDHTDKNVQVYFAYDAKKSGGVTISHLRMGDAPIKGSYQIQDADFIACHNQAYVHKYQMTKDLKNNGIFLINTIWNKDELINEMPNSMKIDLAKKNAKLYMIDAVNIAKELGLGGRINMVMQAAFFKLSNIIPIDDAAKYMKEEIVKTYGNKGQDVIDMNCAAVDKGIAMIEEIEVPKSWADLTPEAENHNEKLPPFIDTIIEKMGRQEGNSVPVSAFLGREDGSFPNGVTQYEKRAISIEVPVWDKEKCIQCNQCSVVCSHACIRPTLLNEDEAKNAPAGYEMKDATGFKEEGYKYHLAISGADCSGCAVCVNACPAKEKAIKMVPYADLAEQNTKDWKYSMEVSDKVIKDNMKNTIKGSQFLRPYLEFSGACAGCGETPYVKLITQLYGDKMMVANSAGCSHIWGGSAEIPFSHNKLGQGPAWGCSLFEDTAEYGYGMSLGQGAIRRELITAGKELLEEKLDENLKSALKNWLDNIEVTAGNRDRADALVAALENSKSGNAKLEKFYEKKDYFVKASQWVFGGDGWAYDIDFQGIDHVLASGDNVNLLVMDTEVYSNTGGQSSKATPAAAIAQFAASGKKTKKKDLGMMAMSYGYVYVAQVAMGYDMNQTLKAIKEAEAYDGPSIIIAYAPCINHGIKGGMSQAQLQIKRAVEAGYWHTYRYNPDLKKEGKNPFVLDSPAPNSSLRDFLLSEVRYASLARKFPETAEELYQKAEADAKERYENYVRLTNG